MNQAGHEVECAVPILPVADLERSIRFYTGELGFRLDWRSGSICSVSRDGHPIMLSQGGAGRASCWVWIGLESDALFRQYRDRNVKVRQEPMNWSWGYEMKFEDPDGNVLWLGTEPREDMPKEDAV